MKLRVYRASSADARGYKKVALQDNIRRMEWREQNGSEECVLFGVTSQCEWKGMMNFRGLSEGVNVRKKKKIGMRKRTFACVQREGENKNERVAVTCRMEKIKKHIGWREGAQRCSRAVLVTLFGGGGGENLSMCLILNKSVLVTRKTSRTMTGSAVFPPKLLSDLKEVSKNECSVPRRIGGEGDHEHVPWFHALS
jgi:hypothetical protein